MAKRKISFRRKMTFYFAAAFLLPTVAILIFIYFWTESRFFDEIESRIQSVANLVKGRTEIIEGELATAGRRIEGTADFVKLMLAFKNDDLIYGDYIQLGVELATEQGLDEVSIYDNESKLITSAIFPERYGIVDREFTESDSSKELYRLIDTAEGRDIMKFVVLPVPVGKEKNLYICTGKRAGKEMINLASAFNNSYAVIGNEKEIIAGNKEIGSVENQFVYIKEGFIIRDIFSFQLISGERYNLTVFYSQKDITSFRSKFYFLLLILLLGGIIISILVGNLLARPVARRIGDLLRATRLATLGETEVKIDTSGGDDIETLTHNFKGLIREIEIRQQKLLEAERNKAWSDIARKMAHEIRNPLSPIRISAQSLVKAYEKMPGEFDRILKESAEIISEEVDRISRTVDEFVEFAKMPPLNKSRGNINEIVNRVAVLYSKTDNVKIKVMGGEIPDFYFDPDQIYSVLHNIVKNGIESADGESVIEIETSLVVYYNDPAVEMIIKDNGCGMNEETLNNLFTPYFTTKQHGTGIGLIVSRRIILEHDGQMQIKSKEGEGTTVFITLPLKSSEDRL